VRAFVAVPVPRAPEVPSARSGLPPEHLTLRFLGEISDTLARDLAMSLGPALAPFPSFEIVLKGVGAFPTTDRPRVVWRGVTRGTVDLHAVAQAVNAVVTSLGGAIDPAPFVPHVTLFRVRSPSDRARAADLLHAVAPAPPTQVVPVTAIELVASRLTPTGADHTTLARFPLGPAPDQPASTARSATSFRHR
jgi:RNA 2',3'-cyclic 3'-phosphodiesterase